MLTRQLRRRLAGGITGRTMMRVALTFAGFAHQATAAEAQGPPPAARGGPTIELGTLLGATLLLKRGFILPDVEAAFAAPGGGTYGSSVALVTFHPSPILMIEPQIAASVRDEELEYEAILQAGLLTSPRRRTSPFAALHAGLRQFWSFDRSDRHVERALAAGASLGLRSQVSVAVSLRVEGRYRWAPGGESGRHFLSILLGVGARLR